MHMDIQNGHGHGYGLTVKLLSAFQRIPERVFTLITSLLKSGKSSLYWPFVRTSLISEYFQEAVYNPFFNI
jgi:hypothetical protein